MIKSDFEEQLREDIDTSFLGSELYESISYAALAPSKRVRSLVVIKIAELLNKGFRVIPAAIALEYAHTSSLILDDLPVMDDALDRRGKLPLHRAFSEKIALMTSVALISEAYQKIYQNGSLFGENSSKEEGWRATAVALDIVSKMAGAKGTPNGQILEGKKIKDASLFHQMIDQKTGTLFVASFSLGWLFGGGEISLLNQVKEVGYCFGRLFQLSDDLTDLDEDKKLDGCPNFALYFGLQKTLEEIEKEKEKLEALLLSLGLTTLRPILLKSLDDLSREKFSP